MRKKIDPFSTKERELLQKVTPLIAKNTGGDLNELADLERAVYETISILVNTPPLTGKKLERFIEKLCQLNPLELKLHLPPKGLLSESFLMLKMHYFKEILALLPKETPTQLRAEVTSQISYIIHTYLLGQLLIDLLLNKNLEKEIRRAAAYHLLLFWEESSRRETLSEFFLYIHQLWDARSKVKVNYGTLLGTSEFLQLIEAQCPKKILDFFLKEGQREVNLAFMEFIFGLSYEELEKLKKLMQEKKLHSLSPREVSLLLGKKEQLENRNSPDPHLVYRSYKQRRSWARYRAQTGQPGPKHTAEEYLILNLIQKEKNSTKK